MDKSVRTVVPVEDRGGKQLLPQKQTGFHRGQYVEVVSRKMSRTGEVLPKTGRWEVGRSPVFLLFSLLREATQVVAVSPWLQILLNSPHYPI